MLEKLPQQPTLFQRYQLLHKAKTTPHLQRWLSTQCANDIHFWFRWFAWTFDPRLPQPRQPFLLYEFQTELVDDIVNAIETGDDRLIEKSRDMGASWVLALVFLHYWLYSPGAQFLLGSRKFDLVDSKGDLASLMEKLRFALAHLPPWMRPTGYTPHKHAPLGRLINPDNGAAIIGETCTADFGRGGRYKAVLLDEFAFWGEAEAAYAGAGQSSPCRLVVSTPYGKNNAFARLRFGGGIQVHTLHWQRHPAKDTGWYQRQKARMSADEVARELDIHYTLSVKNRVYREFTPSHKLTELQWNPHRKLIRVWDFGYHTPAVVWCQVDEHGRLLILRELVGESEALIPFAERVLQITSEEYPGALIEDMCDPAGKQTHHQSGETSLDVLRRLGVNPWSESTPLGDGVEKVRHLMLEERGDTPGLLVDARHCPVTVEAFEGGYRYRPSSPDNILEEHPYEDVMDCVRYAVWSKVSLLSPAQQQLHWRNHQLKARSREQAAKLRRNRYTAY